MDMRNLTDQIAANYPTPEQRRAGFTDLQATLRQRDGWTVNVPDTGIPNAHYVRWDGGTCHQASVVLRPGGVWSCNAWSSTADWPIREGLTLAEAVSYAEQPAAAHQAEVSLT